MSSKSKNAHIQYTNSFKSDIPPEKSSSPISGSPSRTLVSSLIGKNISVLGRRTSVRLEPEMWDALYDIAAREKTTIHHICSLIHMRKHRMSTLTAAIRVFLLLYYRAACTDEGHARVRHGDFSTMMKRARITQEDIEQYFSV